VAFLASLIPVLRFHMPTLFYRLLHTHQPGLAQWAHRLPAYQADSVSPPPLPARGLRKQARLCTPML
jgi:hypothetical protein